MEFSTRASSSEASSLETLTTAGSSADPPASPPAPLAGDQLVAVVPGLSHQDRLQHPELTDRGGQAPRRSSSKWRRGWCGFGTTWLTGRSRRTELLLAAGIVRDEGPEAPTQSAAARHRSPPVRAPGRRSRLRGSVERGDRLTEGGLDNRTVRGMTCRQTTVSSPRRARTSRTTWSESLVRASYMTSTMVLS